MVQKILTASEDYRELDACFKEAGIQNFFLVCDSSLQFLKINSYFQNLPERTSVKFTAFSNFQPNPLYESVEEGVKLFNECGAQMIVAVGGGSALDIAKCIKLYSNLSSDKCYLEQEIIPNDVPLITIPTTAGTGSEATRYAVIYYKGSKQSVTDYSIIPSVVLMDASVLKTLPMYQKKATMLDAFCHAIESYWSVNSTKESRFYSCRAIQMIIDNKDAYLADNEKVNASILSAANLAGKAINITQTTAGHAMCYKITSLYGFAHGHAAALCISKLWPWMLENTDKCIDPRGEEHLKNIFHEIATVMGCSDCKQAAAFFHEIVDGMDFKKAEPAEADYEQLKTSVNPVRLKNHPIALDVETIDKLYHNILS